MSIVVQGLTESFVAEVGGIDLSAPMTAEDLQGIRSAFARYAVLVFPDQTLQDSEQIAFASHFGPLQTTVAHARKDHKLRLDEKIIDVGNLDAEGRLLAANSRQRQYNLGNRLWHTDSSFKTVPAYCSMLYAHSIARIGGQTEFADMRAAYRALAEPVKQQIAGLIAEHSLMTSRFRMGFTDFDENERKAFVPTPQVMVRRLPDTGETSLYIGSYAGSIKGMSPAEGAKLIDELIAFATQRQFVYTHRWRRQDLIMWDNRCTMHRGLPFDDQGEKRDLRRVSVSDTAPVSAPPVAATEPS